MGVSIAHWWFIPRSRMDDMPDFYAWMRAKGSFGAPQKCLALWLLGLDCYQRLPVAVLGQLCFGVWIYMWATPPQVPPKKAPEPAKVFIHDVA